MYWTLAPINTSELGKTSHFLKNSYQDKQKSLRLPDITYSKNTYKPAGLLNISTKIFKFVNVNSNVLRLQYL